MNEDERSSQVSALFDGELDAAQADLVTRRLLKDPVLRERWARYALIGASLRGDPVSAARPGGADVADRVRVALEREPLLAAPGALLAAPASALTGSRLRTLGWGAALAASVATAAILVMRMQLPDAGQAPMVASAAAPAPAAASATLPAPVVEVRESASPAYTTPVEGRGTPGHFATPLVNYVVAHSEYTTPVVRLSPLSSVISGNFDPTENTVEMTEAEVGARR